MSARIINSIEDWPKVKQVVENFLQSLWADRVDISSLYEYEKYFIRALDDPLNWAFILIEDENKPTGFAIVNQVYQQKIMTDPDKQINKLVNLPHGFIIAAYNVDGYKSGQEALDLIIQWCKLRGHTEIYAGMVISSVLANTAYDSRRRLSALFERYGFKEDHVVVKKLI